MLALGLVVYAAVLVDEKLDPTYLDPHGKMDPQTMAFSV